MLRRSFATRLTPVGQCTRPSAIIAGRSAVDSREADLDLQMGQNCKASLKLCRHGKKEQLFQTVWRQNPLLLKDTQKKGALTKTDLKALFTKKWK